MPEDDHSLAADPQPSAQQIAPAPMPQLPPQQAPTPWITSSNFPRRSLDEAPFRSVPVFRRTHPLRTWNSRFDAAASRAVHCRYASDVQLAPLQLRLARIHHPRRQADRPDLFRRFSGADPREFVAGQRPRLSLDHSDLRFDTRRDHPRPAHLATLHLHLSARRPVPLTDQHADVVDVWPRTGTGLGQAPLPELFFPVRRGRGLYFPTAASGSFPCR